MEKNNGKIQIRNRNILIFNLPAPINPKAKIELCATSVSVSWLNLVNVSKMFNWGLETEIKPKANGTARRIAGSQ